MTSSDMERLSFEDALNQLETIVKELESDSVPLEQTISLYEKANELARYCSEILEKAKLRIDTVKPSEPPT